MYIYKAYQPFYITNCKKVKKYPKCCFHPVCLKKQSKKCKWMKYYRSHKLHVDEEEEEKEEEDWKEVVEGDELEGQEEDIGKTK